MTAILTLVQTFLTTRINTLKASNPQRGSLTLQEVLWAGFWILAAGGAVAAITAVVVHYVSQIHI